MQQSGLGISSYGLENHGIKNIRSAFWNLSTAELYEEAIRRREGLVTHLGPLCVRTGSRTGRSPNDRFVVEEATSKDKVWWGPANRPYPPEKFEQLYQKVLAYLQTRDLYVQDCYAGAAQKYSIPVSWGHPGFSTRPSSKA